MNGGDQVAACNCIGSLDKSSCDAATAGFIDSYVESGCQDDGGGHDDGGGDFDVFVQTEECKAWGDEFESAAMSACMAEMQSGDQMAMMGCMLCFANDQNPDCVS